MKTVNDLPLMVPETSGLKSVDIINSGVITADAAYEAQASIVRNSIPSGFVTLGELDYDYMSNNENKVKLKTESVAYVNGYEIRIPKGTVIDIGRAPEKKSREDLLFLEVWKSEPKKENHVSAVTGTHYELTDNSVKVEWRIRHVADVDFNKFTLDGIYTDNNVNWSCVNRKITAQGGNPQPIVENTSTDTRSAGMFIPAKYQSGFVLNFPYEKDNGLFVTGTGSSVSRTALKTADGYAYAIPMFRLYRKPSCGKSIPFEYSKINSKVDYSKFAKLMKEEKVERVVTENIKGRSLVNLLNSTKLRELGWGVGLTYTFDSANCTLTNPGNNDFSPWDSAPNVMNLIPSSRVFTLILENIKSTSVTTEVRLYNASRESKGVSTANIAPHGIKKLKIQTDADTVGMSFKLYSGTAPSSCKVMALEGDWTSKEIPEFFTGLRSLGEDDGNLVTVKNGILSDDTYDINDGNQKLATFPQVTHVLSENTITPKVVANVKRGQEVIESLDKLGTKLTTDGTEEIEFTKIKGRTIQNCYPMITTESFSHLHGTVSNGYVTLQGSANYQNAFIPMTKCLIKPNTTYTMVVNVIENTLIKDFILASNNPTDVFKKSETKVLKGKTGTHKFLVTSAEQLEGERYGLRSFLSENETGKIKFKVMLVEGNHLDTPIDELPFIDGIKSVGETDDKIITLSSCGKNLFDDSWLIEGKDINDGNGTITNHTNHTISKYFYLPKNKKFIIRGKQPLQYCILHFYRNDIWLGKQLVYQSANTLNTGLFDYTDLRIEMDGMGYSGIQIEEGTASTGYEPYTGHTQQVHLKEPLRSLTNEIYDEIVGNKVIRRIGKVILDGSENWSTNHNQHATLKCHSLDNHITLKGANDSSARRIICDKLTVSDANLYHVEIEGIFLEKTREGSSRLHINSTESDIKAWLKQNPITLYYELANPVEEYLENVYEKESIKTYQLDAPLRSLPNGVKDEIKDGVLIRRCGEVIFDGSDDETWMDLSSTNPKDNHLILCKISPNDAKANNTLSTGILANNIISKYTRNIDAEGVWMDGNGNTYVAVAKTRLTPINKLGFTTWLSKNPLRVIYELTSPIKTRLTEVKPQTANFTLQRQFAEGNWLRELPNGVRDTIENGKVVRRVGEITLNGSSTENWKALSLDNPDRAIFVGNGIIPHSTNENVKNLLSNVLPSVANGNITTEGIVNGISPDYAPIVFIDKKRLPTPNLDGFKQWLSKNPMTVLYELSTPQTQAISSDNYMSYPCHDFNTYCGSMYVGEGRNYILSDNKMPSEDSIIVKTDFRKIAGKDKVEDCRYKKCDDGADIAFIGSRSKNLIDPMEFAKHVLRCDDSAILVGNELTFTITRFTQFGNIFPIHGYYKNTQLTCSVMAKRVSGNSGWYFGFVYDDNSYSFDSKTTNINEYMLFKATSNPAKNLKGLGMSYGMGGRYTVDLSTLQVELGPAVTSHEPFKPTPKYLEVIKENDIDDLRHQVSLTGFNYDKILNESFDKLLRGEL